MSSRRRGVLSIGAFLLVAMVWLWLAPGLGGDTHEAVDVDWTFVVNDPSLASSGTAEVTVGDVTVRLIEGSLSVFSATAVPCEHEHDTGVLRRFFGMPSAWAGHGDGSATTVRGPTVIDLTSDNMVRLGTATAHEPSYCEAHASFAGSTGAERLAGSTAPTLHLVVHVLRTNETGPREVERIELTTTSVWGSSMSLSAIAIAPAMTVGIAIEPILAAVAASDLSNRDDAAQAALSALQLTPCHGCGATT